MSEGLAQGPYVAARVEFEPATLQIQGTELSTEPQCPLYHNYAIEYNITQYNSTQYSTNQYNTNNITE